MADLKAVYQRPLSQLETLGYTASPGGIPFEIKVSEFGDIVDGLEFTIENR